MEKNIIEARPVSSTQGVEITVDDLKNSYLDLGLDEKDFQLQLTEAQQNEAQLYYYYHSSHALMRKRREAQESIKNPAEVTRQMLQIMDKFKEAMFYTQDSDGKKNLVENMSKELSAAQKMAITDGVNFSYCHMDSLTERYGKGMILEFDCIRPALYNYNFITGAIDKDKLVSIDIIGLEIAKLIKQEFAKSRLISFYDDYSNYEFSELAQNNFKSNILKILIQNGLLNENDTENRDYYLLAESKAVSQAEELVARLENVNGKSYVRRDGLSIKFVNEDVENPIYSVIDLRTAEGQWERWALDASTFLAPINNDIVHLVILPYNYFINEQDRVWEILRILGIESENYHNIFYDENLEPEKIVETIRREIHKYRKHE